METSRGRQESARDRISEAEWACGELRDALGQAGVTLPSLGLDPVSFAGNGMNGLPVLVDLGRCNVATARALAAALRPGTGEAAR
ncbi:hypothetical protein [Streptomyces sp. NPDC058045]|uniref:hypothetical protein n=1 Tax=Streptomyces sp. NPDC058045 TaxID=3346311 RepID=UPI0036E71767